MSPRDETAVLQALMRGPEGGVPKYLRLRNAMAEAIAKGRWKKGARLPAEEKLVEATGLSLGTVQKALRALADDGLVVRQHGRGTFVASGEAPMNAPFYHCRFLDDAGDLLPIFSKFVRRRRAMEGGEWSRYLSGRDIRVIERTFSINGEFSIYTHLYFDAARLPVLTQADAASLSGVNVKALIARDLHISLARFTETMQVAAFPDYVCEAIAVRRGTSGAVLQIAARDRAGEVVYFQDLWIPPTRRRLFIAE